MLPVLCILLTATNVHALGVAGDTCTNAVAVTDGFTPYNTTNHSDSGYSPESTCDLMGIMYRDVWFSYEAIDEDVVTVSTCDTNSFDTSIIVYELGTDCDDVLYLTCSGDAPSDSSCQPYHSVVQFYPTVGSTYLVRVGGWDTNSYGAGTLTLERGKPDVPSQCPTDLNNDYSTNVTDLLYVINQWGACSNCDADIDESGEVNVSDLLQVISAWGLCPLQGTWRVMQNSPVAPYLHHDDIVVIGDTIWICNVSGEIWKSIDDGENWTRVCYQEGTSFRCLTFIDALHGWAGNLGPGSWVGSTTDLNPLYITVDGGETWTAVPFENINGPIPDGICGIHAVDRNTIFAAGRYAGGAYFLSSTNGGLTWDSQYMGSDFYAFVDIWFLSPLEGYITGTNNQGKAALVYTDDGGATWTTRITNFSGHYWKTGFASDTFGYAVCSGGQDTDKWVQTYDGGETWNEGSFTDGFHANGIGFLNDQVGWIGGYDPHTLQTWDGGKNWQSVQIDLVYGDRINRFLKVSETEVYAVGNRVYKYGPEVQARNTERCNADVFNNAACSITAVTRETVAKGKTTSITYTVPEDDNVILTVFIRGSLIYDRPVDTFQRAGTYTIEWEHPEDYTIQWEHPEFAPELFVSIQTGKYRQWEKFVQQK